METTKHAINVSCDIVAVDSNTVAIKTLQERFCLRGANISLVLQDVLEQFDPRACLDSVASLLISKYNVVSLKRLLDFLVDKNILVDEHLVPDLATYNWDFLEKSFHFTFGGIPLKQFVSDMSAIKIGIIGSNLLTHCLLDCLVKSGLVSNLIAGITDYGAINRLEDPRVGIKPYQLYEDSSGYEAIVRESDFVFLALNKYDNYLLGQINKLCCRANKKMLRILVDGAQAEVGPLFIPGVTCCYSCLHVRNKQNMSADEYIFDMLHEQDQSDKSPIVFNSLYPLNAIVSAIASTETLKHFAGMKCSLMDGVLLIDGLDFKTQKDYVFRNYTCPICGEGEFL